VRGACELCTDNNGSILEVKSVFGLSLHELCTFLVHQLTV
jgi:hypothetical protein